MRKFALLVLIIFTAFSIFAQTKKPVKKNTKPTVKPTPQTVSPQTQTVETEPTKTPTKKNERPTGGNSSNGNSVRNQNAPVYFYEFSQPAFVVSKVFIEHDENGKGKISFMKSISDEMISEPIEVSPLALERIKNAFAALNFLDSTENYQYEKDYSHLGNVKIRVKKAGKERETKFNWTQNQNAKIIAEEYRKIGNQYIWMFDMNVSRENQPLESPKLMDVFDSYIRRNEVSDATQMIAFLKELSDDERIPLIARNHAARLIKEIEKEAGKK